MRIGIGSFVASGKICKVLLLGVATMAIAIPGRDVALGQAGPGSNPLSNPYAFTTIDVPGVFDTEPHGINGAGQIVGTFKDTGGVSHGFLRDAGGAFTTIDIPGATSTAAYGINDTGQIVGTFKDTGGSHGFLRDAGGTYSAIDVPGATGTEAHGINPAGQIVGSFVDTGGVSHGFLRDAGGTYSAIDVPGATGTTAFGINSTGQIVGAFVSTAGPYHGFLRDAGGTFTTIDRTGPTSTEAFGINDTGQIVGASGDNTGEVVGFLRDAGGTFTIISGSPSQANGINGASQIVGDGQDPNTGTIHGYLAVPSGLIQQAANSGTNIPSLTVTLPKTPRPGDVLIVMNVSNNNQVNVSGGGVSSWTYLWSQAHENTVIVYGTVGSSPSATLTMDLIGTPSPGDLASIVSEWADLSGIADGSGTATGTVSPIRTGAVTTGNANDLLIAVGGDTGSATPGSWTAFNPTYTAQLPQAKIEAAYQIVSATGSYSHTWSDNGSTGWDAVIAALQGSGIALVQQAAAGLTGYPGYLYVVFNQEPRPGDVLVVTNVSSNNQVAVSGGGVDSWNYVWSQAHENTVIVYGTVGSNPDNRVRMDLIGTPSGTGDLTSIVSEWAGLSGTVDSSGTATGTASPIQTGTLTTVNATDLLIAVGGDTGSMTPGWWTAFTPPTQQPHAKIEAAYQIVSATGSYSNTWSDIGSTGWDAVIAAFK